MRAVTLALVSPCALSPSIETTRSPGARVASSLGTSRQSRSTRGKSPAGAEDPQRGSSAQSFRNPACAWSANATSHAGTCVPIRSQSLGASRLETPSYASSTSLAVERIAREERPTRSS